MSDGARLAGMDELMARSCRVFSETCFWSQGAERVLADPARFPPCFLLLSFAAAVNTQSHRVGIGRRLPGQCCPSCFAISVVNATEEPSGVFLGQQLGATDPATGTVTRKARVPALTRDIPSSTCRAGAYPSHPGPSIAHRA